ncbi:PRC-barrel domain-containing protein [Marinisporobacter balticus]|uniref:Uncharacterized protein YrrD n=1 Tax=Marinisporobacter balticus TaxID=2018667 RepID=A0A4R2L505_9FIRM|nr:PRC-barrel domain-containing protein [Marinisporobacter balticus]TCO79069.1 uncharacterized protein YrrD [Marinisporobacter balticus]
MRISGNDIVGLPVVCLDESCKTMEIKDIIYCNKDFIIIGFLLDEGGYFHQGKMISFEKVVNIGENAMVVQNQKSIIEITKKINQFSTRQKIIGSEVVTNDGNHVGIVQDLMIEFPTGKILEIILTEGLFDDLVDGRSILPLHHFFNMDQHTIIINQSINESIVHNTGGLKKLLSLE